jgi:hypothetical protein
MNATAISGSGDGQVTLQAIARDHHPPTLVADVPPSRATRARTREIRSTRTGMTCDPLLPFETWRALGAKLGTYVNASAWWLGDWLVFGQAKYGRRYKDAIAATGLDYQTLRNYAVVSRRFPMSRRRDSLSFQHHADLCALPDDEQDLWLDRAMTQRWSRNELRRNVRAAARPDKPFGRAGQLIVALDPERERRWRDAAQRSRCELEDWVVRALDEAARH